MRIMKEKDGISIIAAVAKNGVIGNSKLDKMPWFIPEELKFFRLETFGKVVVMGRKTAEQVGELDSRRCIVMSRDENCKVPGFETMSYAGIVNLSQHLPVMICGGAEIYSAFLDIASSAIISELDFEAKGDIFMPNII